MDINQIISVIKVADTKSFSKAAKESFISQSAISLRISKLENELGFKIFDRDGQKVVLTENGNTFYNYAEPVAIAWENLQRKTADLSSKKRTSLRIGLVYSLKKGEFFNFILTFIKNNPAIDISLSFNTSKGLRQSIYDDEIDVAFLSVIPELIFQERPVIKFYLLFTEKSCLLVSSDSELASRKHITLEEAEKLPFIAFEDNTLSQVERKRMKSLYGIEPHFAFSTDNLESIYDAVAQGIGVHIDTESIPQIYQGISSIPFDPPIMEKNMYMIFPKRYSGRPEIKLLKKYMLRIYGRTKR